ncbi:hypothetical protein WSS15_18980 [Acetobacter pasteurianus]|nr:hypothetical protein WSS15_18980 [Acetobacter pasteurianus]
MNDSLNGLRALEDRRHRGATGERNTKCDDRWSTGVNDVDVALPTNKRQCQQDHESCEQEYWQVQEGA